MDYITFQCSECGAKLGVEPKNVGLTAICAKCSRPIKVPSQHNKASTQEVIFNQPIDEFHPTNASAAQFCREYAGFWRRFAAALIDTVVLFVCSSAFAYTLGLILSATIPKVILQQNLQKLYSIGNLLGLLLYWVYYAIFESSSKQATLGKRLLQIKVTGIDGSPISFARATGRHCGKFISILTFGLGYLMAGFSKRKQTLHDMISDCLVVYSRIDTLSGHVLKDSRRLSQRNFIDAPISSSKQRNALLLVLGIFLHVLFANENRIFHYIYKNGIGPEAIFSTSFWHAYIGTLLYASGGIVLSLIIIFPIAYFFVQSSKKQVLKSINYAVYIGLALRVLSYFLPEGPD